MAPGQSSACVNVMVLQTNTAEFTRTFAVNITSVVLQQSSDPFAANALPTLGNATLATVNIMWHDYIYGLFAFGPIIPAPVVVVCLIGCKSSTHTCLEPDADAAYCAHVERVACD